MTHNGADPTHRYEHPDDRPDGNVRHYCLTHTLGGIFFRVLSGGDIKVGDAVELVSRPHPECAPARTAPA
jgi:MOSC domain-containing protein YiiM